MVRVKFRHCVVGCVDEYHGMHGIGEEVLDNSSRRDRWITVNIVLVEAMAVAVDVLEYELPSAVYVDSEGLHVQDPSVSEPSECLVDLVEEKEQAASLPFQRQVRPCLQTANYLI